MQSVSLLHSKAGSKEAVAKHPHVNGETRSGRWRAFGLSHRGTFLHGGYCRAYCQWIEAVACSNSGPASMPCHQESLALVVSDLREVSRQLCSQSLSKLRHIHLLRCGTKRRCETPARTAPLPTGGNWLQRKRTGAVRERLRVTKGHLNI